MEMTLRQTLEATYEELWPRFFNLLHSRFSALEPAEIQDLYQETYIAVWQNINKGTVREDTIWSTYILTIGMRQACKYLRDNGKEARMTELSERKMLSEIDEEFSEYSNDPELVRILNETIDSMKEPGRSIIKMTYFEGLTSNEIAEQLGYANGRVVITTRRRVMNDMIQKAKTAFINAGILC